MRKNFDFLCILGILGSYQQKHSIILVKMINISCFTQFYKMELKSESREIMSIIESKIKMYVKESPIMSSYAQLSHTHLCTTDPSEHAAGLFQRSTVFGGIDVCIFPCMYYFSYRFLLNL